MVVNELRCPRCGYEDMIFSLPANVECPDCGWKYEYKGIKRQSTIQENIIREIDEYLEQWGSMHYIQIGARVKEILNKHLGEK